MTGQVIKVADGDTVTLVDAAQVRHRIRVAGIDAPERQQRYGMASRRVLVDAVQRRRVTAQCRKTDRYGREVCTLWLGPRDLGLELVRAGLAWHYTAYAAEQPIDDAQRYAQAEADARSARCAVRPVGADCADRAVALAARDQVADGKNVRDLRIVRPGLIVPFRAGRPTTDPCDDS